MISWLLISIISYIFFSIAFLGDKLILAGPSSPKLYTFYVGLLSVLIIVAIPFTPFAIPSGPAMLWTILEAIVYVIGLYLMFLALEKFDVSRVMTTIGAIQPIMILLLTWMIWNTETLTGVDVIAFIILFLGSIFISFEKGFVISSKYIWLVVGAAALFSLDYVISKMVFLDQPFLQGLIWMRLWSFVIALLMLTDRKLRREVFSKKTTGNARTGTLFLFTQSAGGAANILQSFAISLAPIAYLPIVNALRGVQYISLFLMTLFFTLVFPRVLKEKISYKILMQKGLAILLICIGLTILFV